MKKFISACVMCIVMLIGHSQAEACTTGNVRPVVVAAHAVRGTTLVARGVVRNTVVGTRVVVRNTVAGTRVVVRNTARAGAVVTRGAVRVVTFPARVLLCR